MGRLFRKTKRILGILVKGIIMGQGSWFYILVGLYDKYVIPTIASGEASRRYYSAKQFSIKGIPAVFSLIPLFDTKYFDFQNIWYRFDSEPLKRSLGRFAKFPIATSFTIEIIISNQDSFSLVLTWQKGLL